MRLSIFLCTLTFVFLVLSASTSSCDVQTGADTYLGSQQTSGTDYRSLASQYAIDAGIPSNRIVIGGFSQGSGVAFTAGLSSEYSLAGIIG